MPSRAAPWTTEDDPSSAWSEAPKKRTKLHACSDPVDGSSTAKRRRKRRLSWGPSGPPPKLARDAAGERAELTWELEPQPVHPDVSVCDELALACVCADPVPEPSPVVYPATTVPLVFAPHAGGISYTPTCAQTRGRMPLLLADRNAQRPTHGTPPVIKLPRQIKQPDDSIVATDGVRSCWIEEIDEDEDATIPAAQAVERRMPIGTMDENCQQQGLWWQQQQSDEVTMW